MSGKGCIWKRFLVPAPNKSLAIHEEQKRPEMQVSLQLCIFLGGFGRTKSGCKWRYISHIHVYIYIHIILVCAISFKQVILCHFVIGHPNALTKPDWVPDWLWDQIGRMADIAGAADCRAQSCGQRRGNLRDFWGWKDGEKEVRIFFLCKCYDELWHVGTGAAFRWLLCSPLWHIGLYFPLTVQLQIFVSTYVPWSKFQLPLSDRS